jgi:hypothetical protein
MSTIIEIEDAVQKLPTDQLGAFREWFLKFDAEVWDRQFEEDVRAGRLDATAEEAVRDFRDGKNGSMP